MYHCVALVSSHTRRSSLARRQGYSTILILHVLKSPTITAADSGNSSAPAPHAAPQLLTAAQLLSPQSSVLSPQHQPTTRRFTSCCYLLLSLTHPGTCYCYTNLFRLIYNLTSGRSYSHSRFHFHCLTPISSTGVEQKQEKSDLSELASQGWSGH